jgi:phage-related minor tail protein
MTDLATLGLAIDSRPATDASAALDRLVQSSRGAEQATDALATSSGKSGAALAAEASAAARAAVGFGDYGRATRDAGAAATTFSTGASTVTRGLEQMLAAQRAASQGWRDLSAQGRTALDELSAAQARTAANMAASQRIGTLGMAATPQAANQNGRLNAFQAQNLFYQGSDVVSSLGSGISPLTTLLQQGPQIAATFTGPGAASLRGAFATVSDGAASLAARIGVVGGALGTVAVAGAAAIAAQMSYADTQRQLAQDLAGVGRASGVTAGQINAIAPAAATAAGVSVRQARSMAGEFAATGKIGAEMYIGLIASAKDYAATTGQDLGDANRSLASAFADPARGADALDKQLLILNDTTRENIQRLAAQGDRLGAQRALLEAYKTGLTSATELTSAWGRTTAAVGNIVSDIWNKIGETVDRVATGGDLETRLATAQRVLANSQARQSYLPFGIGSGDTAKAQAEVDRLQAEVQRQQQSATQRQQNRTSIEIGDVTRSLNPLGERLKLAEDTATKIRNNLSSLPLDQQGEARRAMEGLEISARRIREDLAQGGSEMAASLRRTNFESQQVGSVGLGRTAAQINFEYAERQRQIEAQNPEPNARNAALQSLEMERVTQLQTAERQSTISENATGGAFSRMSAGVQQQIQAAAQQFSRIPAGIIAGIADKESSGNPNIGPTRVLNAQGQPSTSAYGLGQITTGTARDAIRGGYLPSTFDRTDPSQGAAGIAGVLSMKLDQAGGDINKAIANYYGSKNPVANQAYAADVLRRAGQMGDATPLGQIREQDQRSRALDDERAKLAIVNQYLDTNGEKLDAATRAQQILSEAQARGIPITDSLRQEAERLAGGMASTARELATTRAGRDLGFDRDQLGRDRYEQQAYSRARSIYGDTTTPAAQAYIGQSKDNQYLSDARSTLTDAATGFATALSHGTNAASAFSSALSRIGDKLLGGVIDSLIGSAFKGGGGGLLSMFGFADGGFTGYGGRNQPAGIVHAGEVVFSQSDVARFGGPHVVNAMRLGYPGYADGGPVLPMMPNLATLPTMPAAPANMNGAPGGPQAMTIAVDARGAQGNSEVSAAIQRGVAAGMQQVQQNIGRNINGIVAQGQRRYQRAG